MANPEMALMQFVALTLPAVAILMQAMLNYREQYLEELTTIDFNTEFQLLEWGFLFLVFSGILFGVEILLSSDSLLITIGVGFLTAALPVLALSILVALRRPLYLDESTSVEKEIYDKGRKYSKAILVPAVAGFGTYTIQEFFPDLVGATLISYTNFLNQILTIIVAASITIGSLSILEQYYRIKRGNKSREKWNHLVKAVSRKTVKIIDEAPTTDGSTIELKEEQEKIQQMEEDWESIINKAPNGVDSKRIGQMEQVMNLLSDFSERIQYFISLKEELNEKKKARERTLNRIESIENEIQEREDKVGVPGPDDVQHKITKEELKEARSNLAELKHQVEDLKEETEESEERLRTIEEDLLQKSQSLNGTFKDLVS